MGRYGDCLPIRMILLGNENSAENGSRTRRRKESIGYQCVRDSLWRSVEASFESLDAIGIGGRVSMVSPRELQGQA